MYEALAQEDYRLQCQKLLSDAWGGKVVLDQRQTLRERSHVQRFRVLEAPPGAPASVVAKSYRRRDAEPYDPDSTGTWAPASMLFNDWGGLQFLTQVMGDDSPAPRFFAGDRALGTFLMEDIAAGIDPAAALLGSDPQLAWDLMLDLAVQMGRMHAATAGRQQAFSLIREGLSRQADERGESTDRLIGEWAEFVRSLELPVSRGVEADLSRVRQAILEPGPFLAYIHHDPCPDNWLKVGERMRLFDFETSGFQHALLDGVYGRIHFPTCWCVNRFPEDLPEAMEKRYRAELVRGIPEAAEDGIFYPAVVEACAFWFLITCEGGNGPGEWMVEDRKWGIATLRQRVLLRGQILADLTERFEHLQALGDTVRVLVGTLRQRWPEEAAAIPVYPAFR